MSLNYKKSGVDVDRGEDLVDWLTSSENAPGLTAKGAPHQDKVVAGIGGFASLFRLPVANYRKPCLISCTDGVGTKVLLASHFQDYSGIGQDLVAMCVNDLICLGGEPLFFLDYYATGHLDLENAKQFLTSVRSACHESGCALVGGETAEMPGVYQKNDFDCAGFAVGVVEEDETWGAHRVRPSDRVIGISSSGFHSNGYSLLRRVFEEDLQKQRELLMQPTRLYTTLVRLLRESRVEVHAAAHITGGGVDNIFRVIPDSCHLDVASWDWPEPFREVQRRTGMSDGEMLKTLNCGIGFVLIAPDSSTVFIEKTIRALGWKSYDLGIITSRTEREKTR